jgi:hypothetical protein
MDEFTLEQRVAALEKLVAELRLQIPPKDGTKDWHDAVGLFPHNEFMKEIDAAGQAFREAERKRASRSRAKRTRTKTKK